MDVSADESAFLSPPSGSHFTLSHFERLPRFLPPQQEVRIDLSGGTSKFESTNLFDKAANRRSLPHCFFSEALVVLIDFMIKSSLHLASVCENERW